jgi:hypothetical protein
MNDLGLLLSLARATRTFGASLLCLGFGLGIGFWIPVMIMERS